MKYTCTDIDSLQFGKQINTDNYHFKEFNRRSYNIVDELKKFGYKKFMKMYWRKKEYWINKKINLQDYTSEAIKEACRAYYDTVEGLNNWIIAECIFEQESGLY